MDLNRPMSRIQIQLRGSKLLMCNTLKSTQDGGDGRYSYFSFSLLKIKGEIEPAVQLPASSAFSTGRTRREVHFFDFDKSHVVYNYKKSRSFTVYCIKTGAKLWELNPKWSRGRFIVLRDFQNGLLLASDSTGRIRWNYHLNHFLFSCDYILLLLRKFITV